MTFYPPPTVRVIAAVLALALASAAPAVQPHVPAGLSPAALAQVGEPPLISPEIDAEESKRWAATDPAFRAFVREAGVEWAARWDRRTGHLSFAKGTFPAWLPADHRARTPDDIASTRALLEQRASELMARHPGLLGVPTAARLILDERRSVPVDDGRLWQIGFRVELGGVPVTSAQVSFRLNAGRLVQLGQAGLADNLEIMDVAPRLDAAAISARAESELAALLDAADEVEALGAPSLEVLQTSPHPWRFDGEAGAGLQYRLAWRTTLQRRGAIETWVMLHDAVTGERLFVFDSNRYLCPAPSTPQGRVTGGIFAGPIETTPETVHGIPIAAVTNGDEMTTDLNGVFPYTLGQAASTTLSGPFFDMECQGCDTPAQAYAITQSPGPLELGVGGNNDSGNGISTRAERNTFYHVNIFRHMASTHLSDAAVGGFFTRSMLATVNIDDACNAFFAGNINFFHAAGGCNNTGEIADVIGHEWGHALDAATAVGLADPGMSEGFADVVAWHETHDPRMSPFFYMGSPGGIRNADENVAGVRTWGAVDSWCPGREVHCLGEIYSQPWWDLARLLRQRAVDAGGTDAAGWFLSERLFFQHAPFADTMDPTGANNMYDALELVDDDDGNLLNGIPDGTEINVAFSHHEFVSATPATDSPDCVPPPAPALSLVPSQDPATTNWQMSLSWTAVPGAQEYRVFRNETGWGGEIEVARVMAPGLSFRDDNVADGLTYRYRVMAFLPDGCFSIGETLQSATTPVRLVMGLESFVVDDVTAGNGNGFAEPGETLTIQVSARNLSGASMTGVIATLSSPHPGVVVQQATQSLGNMPVGALASTSPPHFVILLDRTRVACGDVVPLELSFDAAEGCAATASGLTVGYPPWVDNLEAESGWIVDPDGTDRAKAGVWVREVPAATLPQVQEDHSIAPGVTCFVTGNSSNPQDFSDTHFDEVEAGCTTLQSPVYDLGGATGIILTYWRAYDIQAPLDDALVVEIMNGPCGAWTELERIDAPTGGWAQASFALDSVLGGPAGEVKLRFTACDSGGSSDIEAAVDDISFSSLPCDTPEPRPRLAFASMIVGDSVVRGGLGNRNAIVDPGELVRLPIDLRNGGTEAATSVTGTLTLVGGGATVVDGSATWADIGVSQVQRSGAAPEDFAISIPVGAACGTSLCVALDVTYTGPSGTYVLHKDIALLVGRVVETNIYFRDFEAAGDLGARHGEGIAAGAGCAGNPPCDDWQHDTVVGGGAWDPPDSLVPGGRVWGNDLGDHGGQNNDNVYKSNCCSYLEFPPINCSAYTNVRLSFLRWLSVAGLSSQGDGDQARLMVKRQADAGFTTLWEKLVGGVLLDTEWKRIEHDISAFAAGDPGLVIRFELETDDTRQRGGWTLDNLRVYSRSTACTPFDPCGNPPPPPPTGPVLRETGRKDDNGAEFEWPTATIAPLQEFRFYRGTVPDEVTTLLTPPGFVALSFDDTAAPDALYFYRLVLANCRGVESPPDPP